MSWLAPLYLIGGLTIAVPIWLHWIQRRPRGERPFSSLMFLTPSLPRTQRRHRLNHWWLLLLRGLALSLLALAFARPFLQSQSEQDLPTLNRLVAICLDRSGSMQRAGLWQQAQQQLDEVLAGLGPTDHVALFAFDQKLELITPWAPADGPSILQLKQASSKIRPGYARTALGQALVDTLGQFPTVRERTATAAGTLRPSDPWKRHVVVIGDMSQGTDLSALDRYRWPAEVPVDLRTVSTNDVNGSIRVVTDSADRETMDDSTAQVRVRVASDSRAETKTFRVAWREGDETAATDGGTEEVQIPPGGTRVVMLPISARADRIRLEGDAHAYDNDWYVAQRVPTMKSIWFVGSTSDQPDQLAYYLRRADLSTESIKVELTCYGTTDELPELLEPTTTPWVIHSGPPDAATIARWQSYLEAGGRMLVVLESPASPVATEAVPSDPDSTTPVQTRDAAGLAKLFGIESLELEPIKCQEYVLWANIDYRSELFEPFRAAQYNDFSKIRFWRYHRLVPPSSTAWTTLVSYDDQTPALIQKRIGKGMLLVLTSGWAPHDSQFALSTKFVPMLALWMGGQLAVDTPQRTLFVGDTIPRPVDWQSATIRRPDGRTDTIPASVPSYDQTDSPGIYVMNSGSQSQSWAVNVPPEESQTATLDAGEWTRRGIALNRAEDANQVKEQKRRRQQHELEAQQSWWRWLLVACLGVLALETYVAGRTDRASPESDLAPQVVS